MPFLAEEHIRIPNEDLLSWMFEHQQYDPDKPVSMPLCCGWVGGNASSLVMLLRGGTGTS